MTEQILRNHKIGEGTRPLQDNGRYRIAIDERRHKAVIEIYATDRRRNKYVVMAEMDAPLRKLDLSIIDYVAGSMTSQPKLAAFALQNNSVRKMVEYFYRYRSRSLSSPLSYTQTTYQFSESLGTTPDELVGRCSKKDGTTNDKAVLEIEKQIDSFLGEREAEGCASGTLVMTYTRLRTFFNQNGIDVRLPRRYSLRSTYRDRAPTQEEIQELIEIAPVREKAMIAMLATSGIRIGTLVKLRYKHVREDLESDKIPVHIHVPAELTKGKYGDYYTFINDEAASYLKTYLEIRRKGTSKIPPEDIGDDSPLFRTTGRKVVPLDRIGAYRAIRKLMNSTDLSRKEGRRHDVVVHSLRKSFKTQMTTLGVPSDFVEYFMGHRQSTYLKIESKGTEYLRGVYATANIRIRPEKKASLADVLREIIKSRGEDPAKYLKAQVMAGRTVLSGEEEGEIYARAIWEMLRKEIMNDVNASPGRNAYY